MKCSDGFKKIICKLYSNEESMSSSAYDGVYEGEMTRQRTEGVDVLPPQPSDRPDCSAAEPEEDTKKLSTFQGEKGEKAALVFKYIDTAICLCLFYVLIVSPFLHSAAQRPLDEPSTYVGTQYAQPLSFVHDSSDGQITEYVLAFDNSGSMNDSLEKRNMAINAIIRGLPKDRTHVTAFPFTDKSEEILQDILPMNEDEFRKTIEKVVEKSDKAKGGTDLGLMMRLAIGRFSHQGQDPSKRYVLFIVTDGWSDGQSNDIAEARDEEFFSMCETYRENVDIYIIYVSGNKNKLQHISSKLNTQPIELLANTLNDSNNQMITWEKGEDGKRKEYAKILSIPDMELLETAFLFLQFANTDVDGVFCRTAEEESFVSFSIPPLCTQELTIALSGGTPVQGTLCNLKWEGEGPDLLQTAVIEDDPSVVTIRKEEGLDPGLYTMKIKTDTKVSAVISYRNNYKIWFGLENLDNPVRPPAGSETALQMQMLRPNNTPLEKHGSVVLSMRIEHLKKDNTPYLYGEVNNQERLSLDKLEEGDRLRFYPVVICSGTREKIDSFWDVQLSEPFTPGERLESVPVYKTVLWLLFVLSAVVALVMWLWTWKKYFDDKAAKRQCAEKELRFTDDFIRAGICWQLQEDKKYYLGSFGPTDDKGRFRQGCDLSEVLVWCLENSTLVRRKNPLKFCRWRYSPEQRCTELVLRADKGTTVESNDKELRYRQIIESSESTLECFGVDETHRGGTVEIRTPTLEGKFQLSYYYEK